MLTVNNLTIEFHDEACPFLAVDDVSFSLSQGEILGLVGESGSGKSQTALAISGLVNRNKASVGGEILFEGENLVNVKRSGLREIQGSKIGYIFQDPLSSLNPLMQVGWQVEEALRIHSDLSDKELKERALEALKDAGLEDTERIYRSYPFELSGGMRQRALIAAAIITKPKLLIADEPTTALDVTVQAQIISLLLKLHDKYHCGILFISHDLSLIRQICENVLVMKNGKVVERGSVETVFANPQEDYTKKLIDAIPDEPKKDSSSEVLKENKESKADIICEVKDYSFFYPGSGKNANKIGVKNINLSIESGEIHGLVGESGSGKSTLAKCIAGLLKDRNATEIKVGRVAMVFQDNYSALNPSKTIEWLLKEPLRLQGIRDKAVLNLSVKDILEEVELDYEYKNRYPSDLSGGQRQRVGIAQALLCNPDFLIADEPVSALDVTIQRQIMELFIKLKQKRNLTILFISHDLRTVFRLCDKVSVMKNGEILESGNKNEIYFNPKSEYTRELLRSAGLKTENEHV